MNNNTMPTTITCCLTTVEQEDQKAEAGQFLSKVLRFTQVRQNVKDYHTQILINVATFKRKEK